MSAWNPEAGYGTLSPQGGGEEVAVGLAAFPTDGEGPRLDEAFSFEVVIGRDGRKQAVNLKRLPPAQVSSALREATGGGWQRVRQAQRKRRLAWVAGAVVVGVLAAGGVSLWQAKQGEVPAAMRR
ncbi:MULTISPECIES: cold-shock protein [Roseateles]|uniref:Cold shock CspA family protein n=1 Tax=Pelomonas aquatica TaxID=431058 RepID=A0ABU1ZEW0_9BURK|nr:MULTISPECIES: hypothetical protein [Roseateles]MDR7299169.1 cold shock CspA family protein [Pelomonas aquatica]